MEDARRTDIGGGHLRLGMGERHHDPLLGKPHCTCDLFRRHQVHGAPRLLSNRRPLAPGLELRAPLLVLGAQHAGIERRRCGRCRRCGLALRAHRDPADQGGGDEATRHGERGQAFVHAILH
jgi:hypothetical protein